MLAGKGDVTTKRLKHFGLVIIVGHITWLLDGDIETLVEANGLSVCLLKTTRA